MAGQPCEKAMQSYRKQPKIHDTNNAQNFLYPHMISKDADPMGVPRSDDNHVSESPTLTSLASQLQGLDYSILDTPSLTLLSKGKKRPTITCTVLGTKLIGLTHNPILEENHIDSLQSETMVRYLEVSHQSLFFLYDSIKANHTTSTQDTHVRLRLMNTRWSYSSCVHDTNTGQQT